MSKVRNLKAMAFDTGGTMSDAFIIDEKGMFVVGKAQTTPHNESEGIINSITDALNQWDTSLEESGNTIEAVVYSGTAMLNRLLERQGNDNIGVIIHSCAYRRIRRSIVH